jgi:hypothetical protein
MSKTNHSNAIAICIFNIKCRTKKVSSNTIIFIFLFFFFPFFTNFETVILFYFKHNQGTFWRAASLSYLEYVNHASHAVRAALKEPLRSKASSRGNLHLRERWYENGVGGDSKFYIVIVVVVWFCKYYLFLYNFKCFILSNNLSILILQKHLPLVLYQQFDKRLRRRHNKMYKRPL